MITDFSITTNVSDATAAGDVSITTDMLYKEITADIPIPEASQTLSKKRSKWNQSSPENWKRNKPEKLRSMCKDYPVGNSKTERILKAKLPKPVECCSCKFKCQMFFDSEDRERIYKHYWKLNNYCRQKDFIFSCVTSNKSESRAYCVPKTKRSRAISNIYHLVKNHEKIRVCQKYLQKLSTLLIKNKTLDVDRNKIN